MAEKSCKTCEHKETCFIWHKSKEIIAGQARRALDKEILTTDREFTEAIGKYAKATAYICCHY